MQRRSNHTAKLLSVLAALLALLALASAEPSPARAAAAGHVASHRVAPASGYWTKARMRAAEPAAAPAPAAPGSPAIPPVTPPSGAPSYVPPASAAAPQPAELRAGSAVAEQGFLPGGSEEVAEPAAAGIRTHGKVFFTIPGQGPYVCSGTALNSRNRSVVWTAGHCVFDAGPANQGYTNRFSTNFIFVPAYRDGNAPFGKWTARRLATTDAWHDAANLKFDLGAAVMRRLGGRRLQRVVGGAGIGFNQPRDQQLSAFGYPQELPFDGSREYRCDDAARSGDARNGYAGPAPMRISCDMTAGSSGGGWMVGSTLVSVTSYGYRDRLNTLFGPYLSGVAKRLYASVRGKRHPHRLART